MIQWGATEMRNELKIISINRFGNDNVFSVQIKIFTLLQERGGGGGGEEE